MINERGHGEKPWPLFIINQFISEKSTGHYASTLQIAGKRG